MTMRKTHALAREAILFFLHPVRNLLTAVFERDFDGNRISEFDLMNLTAVKKPRAIEFAHKSAYRVPKKKSRPSRNRQTLSKSPCQLSRVLFTLSAILRFREILESRYGPVEQKCARARGLRVSSTINCLVVR